MAVESSSTKVIEAKSLLIRGHLLRCSDTAVQLGNISMVSIDTPSAPPFPSWVLWLTLIGGALMAMAGHNEKMNGVGIVCIFVGIAFLVVWTYVTVNQAKSKYLHIQLNSGGDYYLFSSKTEFMRQVIQLLANIIEQGSVAKSTFFISVKDCEIWADGNIIHVTDETAF